MINKGFLLNIFFVFLLIFACKRSISDTSLLTGDGFKMWQLIDKHEKSRGTITYFRFDSKGGFQVFKKYHNKGIAKADFGDIPTSASWQFLEEKKIDIGGKIYKIESLNDSEFVFVDTTFNDRRFLKFKINPSVSSLVPEIEPKEATD